MNANTDIIIISGGSPVSKYKQIINSVIDAINDGIIKPGDKLPSINAICERWNLSRDTVVNAYNELKSKGVISSSAGKGFYVEKANVKLTHKIFVLFDELNSFKEDLFNSFLENLKKDTVVDIYFHHFNRKIFNDLIEKARGNYTTYVIMPAKLTGTFPLLETLPGRVIVLDQLPNDLKAKFPALYQNFEKDTFEALMSGKEMIKRYNKFIMVYPGGKEPEGQYKGFIKFCNEMGINAEMISNLDNRTIRKGEAYLVIWDRDLVWIMQEAKEKGLLPGRDIGIVSYNDTALKEVVGSGVTTISTNFKQMGHTLAEMIYSKDNIQKENPASLIIRGSL